MGALLSEHQNGVRSPLMRQKHAHEGALTGTGSALGVSGTPTLAHWMPPPHLLAMPPPPQVSPFVHTPQSTKPPQPSATGPQSTEGTQLKGTQPLQGPQSSVPEQPSLTMPQAPAPHVPGVQVPCPH